MPRLPFPTANGKDIKAVIDTIVRMMEDLYEDRIGGAILGDVFEIGEDEVLAVRILPAGGLTKAGNELGILLVTTGGLQLAVAGLSVKCKVDGGLATDVDGTYVNKFNFGTINCPAGTDPVADAISDTLNLTSSAGITITGTASTDTVNFTLDTLPAALAALTPTDGNVIVGDGSTWVTESGATARTSLGLGTGDSPSFTAATTTGDVEITTATNGIILKSPDGTRHRVTVSNAHALVVTAL